MHTPCENGRLPRLVFIGDHKVDDTTAGPVLIYRLLATYPPDRLRIVELNKQTSNPQYRLKGVLYHDLNVQPVLAQRCRYLRPLYKLYLATRPPQSLKILSTIKDFQPQAVLTVTHGIGWIHAWAVAKHLQIPLHLIMHDEFRAATRFRPRFLVSWLERRFGRVYKDAASRLCVSPYMAAHYETRFGRKGIVLYPNRAVDAPSFPEPPISLLSPKSSLHIAYAGSIWSGRLKMIQALAARLAARGSRLQLYTVHSREELARMGIDLAGVESEPITPSARLIACLREKADVLFLPLSFQPEFRSVVSLGFPSKLADYTAAGLPILIWGPSQCAAARWAKENPGAAELVENEDPQALDPVISRLLTDAQHRFQLASTALRVGNACFSYERAFSIFSKALTAGATGG